MLNESYYNFTNELYLEIKWYKLKWVIIEKLAFDISY